MKIHEQLIKPVDALEDVAKTHNQRDDGEREERRRELAREGMARSKALKKMGEEAVKYYDGDGKVEYEDEVGTKLDIRV